MDQTTTQAKPAAAARADADDWNTPFVASMTAMMPNGGKVTMTAPAGHSFDEAMSHLDQTHALYIEWGGWGGGRRPKPIEG